MSEKENRAERYGHGGDWCGDGSVRYDFSVNINPFGLPESGRKAYADSLAQLDRYPDWDCAALRRALAEKLCVDAEHIFCGNGAAELIYRVVQALRPKRALLAVPTFSEYERALQTAGCETAFFELRADRDFALTDDFLEFLTEEIDIVFLCNPNNPTGRIIDAALLDRIQERCREKHIYLVVDECFLEFTGRERESTRIGRSGSETLVLRAFTKLYAMPGLRLGYLVCENTAAVARIARAGQCWNVSVPAQAVGIAVLGEDAYVRESVSYVRREREFLSLGLKQRGYQVVPSEANFILYRLPGREEGTGCVRGSTDRGGFAACADGRSMAAGAGAGLDMPGKLLQRGIRIRECANYRGLGDGYYRIAVRTHEENEGLLRALDEICKEHGSCAGHIDTVPVR